MGENKFNSIFSNNLRYYLNLNNISQAELARRLGVGTTSVYNWCGGIKTPRMDKVDAMCAIFSCKRSDLITEHFDQPAAPSPDPVAPVQLRADESELLNKYNRLNTDGMKEIHNHADYIASQDRFLKDTSENIREVG